MNKIKAIKQLVKKECEKYLGADNWFFETHLIAVEKSAKFILLKLPKAKKEIVFLSVWLHDLQRVRRIKGDHEKIGAREAEKVMRDFKYDVETIESVKKIILCHSCDKSLPDSLEGKILASADAMAHYMSDFYLAIAILGQRNTREYKRWALKKLDRDYNRKIFFPFVKQKVKSRHNALSELFRIN